MIRKNKKQTKTKITNINNNFNHRTFTVPGDMLPQ